MRYMDKMRLSALCADDGGVNANVVPIRTSERYKECRKQLRKWRSVKDVDREIIVRKIAILEAERDIRFLEKRKRKILRRFK